MDTDPDPVSITRRADLLARCADGHAGVLNSDLRARARDLAQRIREARRHTHRGLVAGSSPPSPTAAALVETLPPLGHDG